jgi:aryl-alcohol dehydrogenase-like predicted oxidoreductase
MQFGGPGIVSKFFPPLTQPEVDQIVANAVAGGINWFDTAEMYGWGHAERTLATGLVNNGVTSDQAVIATKWSPIGRRAASIERTIDARVTALDPFPIGIHQIHMGHGSVSSLRSQIRAMARLAEHGTIGAVGVSNFSAHQMERAHAVLAEHGLGLATNQVRVNLLHRKLETDGLADTARRLGVTLIAYSPLAGGILTGKFHADRSLMAKMPRTRRIYGFTNRRLDRTAPLIDGLRDIADGQAASVSQVALAWLTTNYGDNVVAIPGASKPHHAMEAADAMRLRLSEDEVSRINQLSALVGG